MDNSFLFIIFTTNTNVMVRIKKYIALGFLSLLEFILLFFLSTVTTIIKSIAKNIHRNLSQL